MAIKVIVRDKRFLDLFDPEQDYQKIASGLTLGEGPIWHDDLQSFIFNDVPASKTYIYNNKEELNLLFNNQYKANGVCLDKNGRLIMCEHYTSHLSSWAIDGSDRKVLASEYEGVELNSPNDVIQRSDGLIYFTDPVSGRGTKPACNPRPIPSDRRPVFMYNPLTEELKIVAMNFKSPNGLCFSPDEKILYVGDSITYRIVAYDVQPDGSLTNERLIKVTEGEGGPPDGLKVDEFGNILVAAQQGLHWLTPAGDYLGVIIEPERLLNFCFGGKDHKTLLFACAEGAYLLRSKIAGCFISRK